MPGVEIFGMLRRKGEHGLEIGGVMGVGVQEKDVADVGDVVSEL